MSYRENIHHVANNNAPLFSKIVQSNQTEIKYIMLHTVAISYRKFNLQLLSQCGSTYNWLRRSVPEIHKHVSGMLSNQQTTQRLFHMSATCYKTDWKNVVFTTQESKNLTKQLGWESIHHDNCVWLSIKMGAWYWHIVILLQSQLFLSLPSS